MSTRSRRSSPAGSLNPNTVADLAAEVFLAVLDSAHTGGELTDRVGGRRPLDSHDVAELEDRIDAESLARSAFQAMAGLPDGDRAMLELVVIDQLTISETAIALGIRQGAARARLRRARRAQKRARAGGGCSPERRWPGSRRRRPSRSRF
ncbi:sigma factor-like helix-turn-helix DNA-binding protein [Nonomuraea sp. NPDC050153]|uniref:sigma factor-like helix-turn-helix DNA-binding protein n=1 Tax=Nonomuraea sp. NPDC050153 TaxID=3364359 RepID=UPI0037A56418